MRGKTICAICGEVIAVDDDVFATPAFLRPTDQLARYSDAAFHRRCFEGSGERAEVDRLLALFSERMKAAPKTLEEYESWIKDSMPELE
jgi:hypothetical protein